MDVLQAKLTHKLKILIPYSCLGCSNTDMYKMPTCI